MDCSAVGDFCIKPAFYDLLKANFSISPLHLNAFNGFLLLRNNDKIGNMKVRELK